MAEIEPLVSAPAGVSWHPGDLCHSCGSTHTVWVWESGWTPPFMQARCHGCGRRDWDDDDEGASQPL